LQTVIRDAVKSRIDAKVCHGPAPKSMSRVRLRVFRNGSIDTASFSAQ